MAVRCDVRACDLRHSITIQTFTKTRVAGGGHTRAWATHVTARACIEPLTGRERRHAMQLQDSVSHKITIRYQAGIIPAMRILFGTRLFNIRAAINLEERNKWIEIMADEGEAV